MSACAWACGSDPGGSRGSGGSDGGEAGAGGSVDGPILHGSAGTGFEFPTGGSGGSGGELPQEQNLIALRIEPADAALSVGLGETASLEYRAYGRLASAPDTEIELTERTVFYVPDNHLVARFPADGQGTLTTRLPESGSDPAARGGLLTVRAQAANSDGTVSTATTTLTVKLDGQLTPAPDSNEASPALPAVPAAEFSGTVLGERAPLLVYPNDGVLLPPNLGRLEVHFRRGAPENSLFELHFSSESSDLRYYTRCYSDPDEFVNPPSGAPGANDSCALAITGAAFDSLASSNQGAGPVSLTVRASDEAGQLGVSETLTLEFAAERVAGAVYYWTATSPASIVRFDFGSGQSEPETFVAPADVPGNDGSCVGCHTLSRQGDKIAFSLGNSSDGELMFVNDMSRSQSDAEFYAYNGAQLDQELPAADRQNRVLNTSFDPTGSELVAVAPVNDSELETKLFFHDGDTGQRTGSLTLPVVASHPDWSPDGNAIAFTAIDTGGLGKNATTIEFLGGGISLIRKQEGDWDPTPISLIPAVAGKNRYNPSFLPGSAALLFSETDQAAYGGSHASACNAGSVGSGDYCDGYSDPAAKTWAILAQAGATPVLLAKAAASGVADALYPPPQDDTDETSLMDTFPKPTPFVTSHRGKQLGWFTVSSQRRAGLRKAFPNDSAVGDEDTQALLWMFALEPERIPAGEDPSYAGFFLPFQDLSTSNHMAQWTERIVSDDPPPPAPAPPPPPAPPPAPPPVVLR